MNIRLSLAAALACSLSLAAPLHAAEDGQLWEVTTHMDLSKVPELQGRGGGMSDHTQRLCRSSDPRDMMKVTKGASECEVKDLKESGTEVSMAFVCKKGSSGSMKMVYNKGRTQYHGTMKMNDRGRDMEMTMDGKKVGSCDLAKVEQEKVDRHAQIDRMKAQAAATQAQTNDYTKRVEAEQIAKCSDAVDTMNSEGLGYWGMCHSNHDANCKMMMQTFGTGQNAKIGEACAKSADDFCKRYQTVDGFLALNKNDKFSGAEQVCGVPAEELKPRLCKSAVKSDSYEFLAYNCPKDAAPLAKEHCAGRSYTSSDPRAKKDKWYGFCVAVAGRYMEADTTASSSSSGSDSSSTDEADAKGAAKKAAKKAAVNALKGLFGR